MNKIFQLLFTSRASLLFVVLALTGCGKSPFGLQSGGKNIRGLCTMVAVTGLVVNVDAGASTSLEGLRMVIQNGSWAETWEVIGGKAWVTQDGVKTESLEAEMSGNQLFVGVIERTGTFQVSLSHPDLSSALHQTVQVQSDGCHPIGKGVDFHLP